MALGIDRWKESIVDLLKEILARDGIKIRGVYERSDGKSRLQEGMERVKGFLGPAFDTQVEIVENGIRYFVDVENGQKTGYFLDQMCIRDRRWGYITFWGWRNAIWDTFSPLRP